MNPYDPTKKLPPKRKLPERSSIQDLDLKDMLDRIYQLDDDLQKKLDYVCQISGLSRKQVATLLENPSNFHPEKWKHMQLQKELLEQKLYAAFGLELKQKKLHKKKRLAAKERKGKTLGARKRWIDMH